MLTGRGAIIGSEYISTNSTDAHELSGREKDCGSSDLVVGVFIWCRVFVDVASPTSVCLQQVRRDSFTPLENYYFCRSHYNMHAA